MEGERMRVIAIVVSVLLPLASAQGFHVGILNGDEQTLVRWFCLSSYSCANGFFQ